jgi:hypothetical protein
MKYALALLVVFCSLNTFAGKETTWSTLTGKVIDQQTGEPLIGAKVQVDGHYYEVYTMPDGTFEIDAPLTENSLIVIEMVSYENLSLPVSQLHSSDTIALVSI